MAVNLCLVIVVLVIIPLHQIYAINLVRDCSNLHMLNTCDECLRCNGHWCKNPGPGGPFCVPKRLDSWCDDHFEGKPQIHTASSQNGKTTFPVSSEHLLSVNEEGYIITNYTLNTPLDKLQLTAKVIESSQNSNNVKLSISKNECYNGNCQTQVQTKIEPDFCSASSRISENFTASVKVEGIEEERIATFFVPCACECSKPEYVEYNSTACSRNGDVICGTCVCYENWFGARCDSNYEHTESPLRKEVLDILQGKKETCNRGDTPSCYSDADCNYNGECDTECGCKCFADVRGAQYFDTSCSGICNVTRGCYSCLDDPQSWDCEVCLQHNIIWINASLTVLEEKNRYDQFKWITCLEPQKGGCDLEYAAKEENRQIYVMVLNDCKVLGSSVLGAGGRKINVIYPIVLAVIALVAAAAAGAYYMRRSKLPALPHTTSMYHNIDSGNIMNDNPIYKPATSSFPNPMYKPSK